MSGKGKERHLFLFKDKLMVTKKKKPKKAGEPVTYEFKLLIDVRPLLKIKFHIATNNLLE